MILGKDPKFKNEIRTRKLRINTKYTRNMEEKFQNLWRKNFKTCVGRFSRNDFAPPKNNQKRKKFEIFRLDTFRACIILFYIL